MRLCKLLDLTCHREHILISKTASQRNNAWYMDLPLGQPAGWPPQAKLGNHSLLTNEKKIDHFAIQRHCQQQEKGFFFLRFPCMLLLSAKAQSFFSYKKSSLLKKSCSAMIKINASASRSQLCVCLVEFDPDMYTDLHTKVCTFLSLGEYPLDQNRHGYFQLGLIPCHCCQPWQFLTS